MSSSHKSAKQVYQATAPAFAAELPQKHGGSLRIYAGEERFGAPPPPLHIKAALALGSSTGVSAGMASTQCCRQISISFETFNPARKPFAHYPPARALRPG